MSAVTSGPARRRLEWKQPWLYPLVGVVIILIVTIIVSGRSPSANIEAALQQGAIVVMLGLGQMFLITAGNGNVDLSMPGVITLAGFAGIDVAARSHSIFLGVLAAIGVGLATGAVNVALIQGIGIPPIVATLASGLVLDSIVLTVGASSAVTPKGLASFSIGRTLDVPNVAWVALGLTIVAAVVLHKTIFGRTVVAIGQNRKAAVRSGLKVRSAMVACYLISGACAAVAGLLLSSMTGASMDIGTPFLLVSIAVVVLGGSRIRGGRSNVIGIWVGSVLLQVLLTLFYSLHLSSAYQYIAEGVIVVVVLAGAADREGFTQ
ncbi:MAG TPA: ABC transporter permease [Trebonia sp.]|jgi:ribose transport system permease protein|nr:ABC transporter permease [Trebonia sp.]